MKGSTLSLRVDGIVFCSVSQEYMLDFAWVPFEDPPGICFKDLLHVPMHQKPMFINLRKLRSTSSS